MNNKLPKDEYPDPLDSGTQKYHILTLEPVDGGETQVFQVVEDLGEVKRVRRLPQKVKVKRYDDVMAKCNPRQYLAFDHHLNSIVKFDASNLHTEHTVRFEGIDGKFYPRDQLDWSL